MSERNDNDENGVLDADVKLTAYALGEGDAALRAEVEARLAVDEDARRVVEEIRATAASLTSEFATVGGPALTAEQRARIASRVAAGKPAFRIRRPYWIGATAAAAAIVAATSWMGSKGEKEVAAPSIINVRDLASYAGSGGGGGNTAGDTYSTLKRGELDGKPLTRSRLGQPMVPTTNEPIDPVTLTTGGEWNTIEEGAVRGGVPSFYPDHGSQPTGGKPAPEVQKGQRVGGLGRNGGGSGGAAVPAEPGTTPVSFEDLLTSSATSTDVERAARGGAGGFMAKTTAYVYGGGGGGGGGRVAPGLQGGQALPTEDDIRSRFENLYDVSLSSTETYAHVDDNPFRLVKDTPLSTFGVDVDTASYSNIRRFLAEGRLPPPGAVRIEEMVNYFPYDYAPPTDGRPFAVRVDVAGCPWKTEHRLVRVGIKGKVVEGAARPASNLVFLIDVSGSMNEPAKLPLLVQSMKAMVEKLEPRDRVAMVVYAGSSGLVLPSTACNERQVILDALDRLQAGGSTNGGAGIELAYATAAANKIDGGVNRVILATDGDFNVGVTDESSLVKLIEEKAKSGVFLSVLGFGSGNYKDAQMEKLADRGNGNYAYVDSLKEGKKALVEQMSGTLVTIAKDVKLQIEFNPAQVGAYRLIGYENRVLAAEDFKDDKKDAGEIGAGHTVTALYEIVPPGELTRTAGVEPLKYQQPPAPTGALSGEMMTVKLRWKEPESDVSTPMEVAVTDQGMTYSSASPDFKFAASVAAFGMLLRGSPYRGQANLDAVIELAGEGAANDPSGLRREFVELVTTAKKLAGK